MHETTSAERAIGVFCELGAWIMNNMTHAHFKIYIFLYQVVVFMRTNWFCLYFIHIYIKLNKGSDRRSKRHKKIIEMSKGYKNLTFMENIHQGSG